MAYGELGLQPSQFCRLTLREFRAMVKGHETRERRARELLAWVLAWVIAPHMKKVKQPNEILGSPTVDQIREVKRRRRRPKPKKRGE